MGLSSVRMPYRLSLCVSTYITRSCSMLTKVHRRQCGPQQTDCSSAPGVLTSLCVDYACEICLSASLMVFSPAERFTLPVMCKEGWTFAVNADGGAECRPFKSLAWRPDV